MGNTLIEALLEFSCSKETPEVLSICGFSIPILMWYCRTCCAGACETLTPKKFGFALQVLNAMASMDMPMFKKHLPEFYPSFTKLICSDQVWCIFVLTFFFCILAFLWAMFVSSKKGCAKCCYVLFSRVVYTLLKNFYFEEWSRCSKNFQF